MALSNSVIVNGTLKDCISLNLNLRTAYRVLFLLGSAPCRSIRQLNTVISELLKWEEVIPQNGYFSISSFAEHHEVKNTMFLNQAVKDSIADYFVKKFSKRPDSGPEKTRTSLFIHWKNDRLKVYADTTGESLDKRGYRLHTTAAPMQETLAAALVLSTGWNLSDPFINPMCGSGTVAIEAAWIARNFAPGLLRKNFSFMHLEGYHPEWFVAETRLLKEKINHEPLPQIFATDLNKHAVNAARYNAKQAQVEDMIEFNVCDFSQTPVPPGSGVVMLNPPYGNRLGEAEELILLYSSIGDFFKRSCAGKTGYVFTGNPELAKKIGLKAKRKMEFNNANMECRLLEFELYEGSRKKKETGSNED